MNNWSGNGFVGSHNFEGRFSAVGGNFFQSSIDPGGTPLIVRSSSLVKPSRRSTLIVVRLRRQQIANRAERR